MNERVIYSAAPDAYRKVCGNPEIYIAPKQIIHGLRKFVSCPLVAVEDVTKTDTWLWINEVAREGTRIVYDRVARYYKVGSEKARRLSRLAEIATVSLVDIVPFCEHRKFLYMPWRYVSRTILGYAHFYAFSGDHGEELDGKIANSLNEELLCRKISGHVSECSPRTLGIRSIAKPKLTNAESVAYTDKRDQLFAKYKTPQPILTRLADLSHAFQSRRDCVANLLGAETAVICNVASYAKHYQSLVPQCAVGTYSKPPHALPSCRRIVFAEPPIITTYRKLDIESMAAPGSEIIDVTGESKVDLFLSGRVVTEMSDIDRFMEMLRANLSQQKRA